MWKNNIVLKILQKEFVGYSHSLSPYFLVLSHFVAIYLPYLIWLIIAFAILWIICLSVKLYLFWKESNKPAQIFEVSPPTSTEQSSFTTAQLFTSVHGLLKGISGMYGGMQLIAGTALPQVKSLEAPEEEER